MASTPSAAAARVLWKGAISFGLVHIPVALHAATREHGIDFDWLDRRSMDPVGYKRVNKRTGREIARAQIVRGVEYEPGRYVVLDDEEIAAAYPRTTQTVQIESFVPADGIPFIYLERPYYVAPLGRGAKVYALLREALARTRRIGVARVVIQTREHLAALVPAGPALVLNLLRWGEDLRPWDALGLPPADLRRAGVSERELKMATQLVEDMSAPWNAADYADTFTGEIRRLVERKVASGRTKAAAQPEPMEEVQAGAAGGAKVVELTELLRRSLRRPGSARKPAAEALPSSRSRRATPRKPAVRRAA